MPVSTTSNIHFSPGAGNPPGAPTAVTSITRDAGATVSFRAPASQGDSAITSYTVTPYIGAAAQAPATVPVGSLGSITGSDGNTYRQAQVTGLTNGTAYTFTVRASNSAGTGPESDPSGANTPLAGLVFGDDFGGPAGGPIDPEWWVYTRCGYLAQSEVQYYLPSQVRLDGNGNLAITAEHTSYTGPGYPSAGGGTVTQPWRSGAVQSNTLTFAPATGNTMTFETRQQPMPDAGNGYWPGMFWLEGQAGLNTWKTDPAQGGWNTGDHAEIDVAEWGQFMSGTMYRVNVYGDAQSYQVVEPGFDVTQAMHVYQARWKPGVSTSFWRDGTQTMATVTANGTVATSACRFFLMIYLQMLTGGPTATETMRTDWVRVFDQNLG